MKSREIALTAGLTLALTSNALLLLLLLYKSYDSKACTSACHDQRIALPNHDPSYSVQFQITSRLQDKSNDVDAETLSYKKSSEQSSGPNVWTDGMPVNQNEIRSSLEKIRQLDKPANGLTQTDSGLKEKLHSEDSIKDQHQSTSFPTKKQDNNPALLKFELRDHTNILNRLRKAQSSVRSDEDNETKTQKDAMLSGAPVPIVTDTDNEPEIVLSEETSDYYLVPSKSSAKLWRNRRDVSAHVSIKATTVDEPREPYGLTEVFSTLTEKEIGKFDDTVSDILIPALVHFEGMIIREVENVHNVLKSHDLRIEEIERSLLSMQESSNSREPQADATDNKSQLDSLQHVLGENFLPVGNGSYLLEIDLDGDDGSGEAEWTTPTTTTTTTSTTTTSTTTKEPMAYQDLYRTLTEVEQKVLALENYNMMSDSELTRVRSEVIKMDDKVTEMDRRQRNLRSRTAMHTYKITEMEMTLGKSEVGIHSALDAYSRVTSRLESFKDRLTELSTDLHGVTVHFHRQDQIANELRAADSYKAHDIQEIRKTVFGLESRLNGLYRVIDENVENARGDLRNLIVRLCFDNKLIC